MSGRLTIYRSGEGWAARDATGAKYGHSPNLFQAIETAERLAKRVGAKVVLCREAQNHLLSQPKKKPTG